MLSASVQLHPMTRSDAAVLLSLQLDNRDFLAPYMPVRDETFFTLEGVAKRLAGHETARALDNGYAYLILAGGEAAGTLEISEVARGPFQSAYLGYWVTRTHNGRGIATTAVAKAVENAFSSLGLHRLQAATLLHNVGSQRVLEKNAFTRIGVARRYLCIAGLWQDHVLFERTAET